MLTRISVCAKKPSSKAFFAGYQASDAYGWINSNTDSQQYSTSFLYRANSLRAEFHLHMSK